MIYVALVLLASQTTLVVLMAREHRHSLEVIESVAKAGSPDLREMVECIDRLCRRIQAPDIAVAQHAQAMELPSLMPAVSMFDDDDHWASKEELAELIERQVSDGVAV